MLMEYALLQAVFLPLLLSPVAYILGKKLGPNAATWFTFGLLLYCTILIIIAAILGLIFVFNIWMFEEKCIMLFYGDWIHRHMCIP